MTKTEFAKEFSRIVNKYPARSLVGGRDANFILQACQQCSRYETLARDPRTTVRVGYQRIANGRKVKMAFLHKEGGAFGVPVSKQVVVDTVYPPKKRVKATGNSPEGTHRLRVLGAMRLAISPQLKEYRSNVQYPVDCWRSGLCIRKGMKTDVDHIGTPFVQLAEEFLRETGMKYTDISLAGPANAKRFKDSCLQERWCQYHKERATLALVLASYNRSAGSGEYVPDESLLGSFSKEGALSLDF